MVSYEQVAKLPEGEAMVRRDPALADKFPKLHRFENIATDEDRQRYGIPSHARLNVPLCMSIEEVAEWAQRLFTLAQRIQVAAAEKDEKEIWKLRRIQDEVAALNRDTLKDINANRQRFYKRKGEER